MFINCPHCRALLATDPATDLPPERCPRCAAKLRNATQGPAEEDDKADTIAAGTAPPASADIAIAAPADDAPVDSDAGTDMAKEAEAIIAAEQDDRATHADPTVQSETEADAKAAVAAASPGERADPAPVAPANDTPADDLASAAPAPAEAPVSVPASADMAADAASAAPATDAPVHDLSDAVSLTTEAAIPASITSDRPADAAEAQEPTSARTPAGPPAMPAATVPASRRDKSAPSFARARKPAVAASAQRRWLLPSLIAGLSLLLALQWVLADRARLAADARWRPFVAQLCGVLRCSLPPWREPSAFALLERDVRAHPTVAGALRVTATFRNDARWPQPWPEVVLTLSDVDGHAVGARAFAAGEYLGARPTQNALSSGQSATIRMDVLEPAPRIVAFDFDFR